LALVYYSLDGPNWTNCRADLPESVPIGDCINDNTRFLSASHECIWLGVECFGYDPEIDPVPPNVTEDLSLRELRLPDNNLVGNLPDEMFQTFTRLVNLIMDGNQINGTLPDTLRNLVDLKVLDLDSNRISGQFPDFFFNMTNLNVIDINSNLLSGTVPTEFVQLVNLIVIQINDNLFTGTFPAESFLPMSRLVVLTINDNDLTGNMDPLCNVREERQEDFESYLRFLVTDCDKVICTCCGGCQNR